MHSAKTDIGYKKGITAKKYKIIRKMDKRRDWKNIANGEGKGKYKQLNSELRKQTKQEMTGGNCTAAST